MDGLDGWTRLSEDLHAALRRLDAARDSERISTAEHKARFDAIGSWMGQRGVRFGRDAEGDLLTAWRTRGPLASD